LGYLFFGKSLAPRTYARFEKGELIEKIKEFNRDNEKTQEETKIDSEKPKFKISTYKIFFRPKNQI
jgi:hypothetical protein